MAKKPLTIFGTFLAIIALAAFGAGLQYRRLLAEREERVRRLRSSLPSLVALPTLSPDDACALAEEQLLSRRIDRALRVDCSRVQVEATRPQVLKLSGVLAAGTFQDAILSGGFRREFCLSRGAEGWMVVGEAWQHADCKFDALPTATTPQAASASVAAALAAARSKAALQLRTDVRAALAVTSTSPQFCASLPPMTPTQSLLILQRSLSCPRFLSSGPGRSSYRVGL